MSSGQDLTRRPPLLCGTEPARRQGAVSQFHMCGIMLVLRVVVNMLVRNASPRGPMCFRSLVFSLSGPCDLLFSFVLLPLGHGLW